MINKDLQDISLDDLPIVQPLGEATSNFLKTKSEISEDFALLIDLTVKQDKFLMRTVSVADAPHFRAMVDLKYTTTGGREVFVGPARMSMEIYSGFLESLPESTPVKREPKPGFGNTYTVAQTDLNVLCIHHRWPVNQIIFKTEESRLVYEYLLKRFLLQTKRAKLQAEFFSENKMPPMPTSYAELPDLPLAEYQKTAIAMHESQEAYALFMEQGTGKTAIGVSKICTEARKKWNETGNPTRVLIVCPRQVRTNWAREFERFTTLPGRVTIIKGGQMKRLELLIKSMKKADHLQFMVCIMSIDTVPRDVELLKRIKWDEVIVDESHKFKSHRSKRYEALKDLRDHSKRRGILTGTPVGNGIQDLFTQLEFIGDGLSGFSSFNSFRKFHSQYEGTGAMVNGHEIEKLVGYRHIPLLHERLSRLAFIITKKQAGLDLPDKLPPIWWEVEMTKRQRKIYVDLRDKLVAEISEILDESEGKPENFVADNILTKLLRLSQVTSGHIPIELADGNKVVKQISDTNPKVDALLDILDSTDRDCKTVIWAIYREDIRIISEALKSRDIKHGTYYGDTSEEDRESYVNSFNKDPEFKVLVCHPASASEGLDLLGYDKTDPDAAQTYAGQVICFSYGWSYLQMSQLVDRVHRRGTRMPVSIKYLTVIGSIDEEILTRLDEKQDTADLAKDISGVLKRISSGDVEESDL